MRLTDPVDNVPLSMDHPLVQEATLNARALVTARIAPGPPNAIYADLLGDMLNRVAEVSASPDQVVTLYAAQLSALATLAAEAILMAAKGRDLDLGVVAAEFFETLDW